MHADDSLLAALIAGLGALAFVLARAWWRTRRFTIVHEWQRGLLYENGRFLRELEPGRHRDRRHQSIQLHTTIPQATDTGPQEALTADRFALRLSALVTWRVTPGALHAMVQAEATAADTRIHRATQQALRQLVAARPLDELLGPRPPLDAALLETLRALPGLTGLDILAAETRDLLLPAELRRMLTEAERSRREAEAALERARGEQAVLRSLANSARLLKGNPALMNLRLLQALQPAPGKARPTVVLGGAAGLIALKDEDE